VPGVGLNDESAPTITNRIQCRQQWGRVVVRSYRRIFKPVQGADKDNIRRLLIKKPVHLPEVTVPRQIHAWRATNPQIARIM
jgi:hypothetical protein